VTALLTSTAPLQITPQGTGRFTSGLAGKNLSLNMPYRVTATPATGMIFKEWLRNGVSFSRNATITFTMEEGLTLTPVFIMNPYPAVVGTFNGLVGEGNLGTGSAADMQAFFRGNGFITLATTAAGSFTGSLRLEGQRLALSGRFDGFGETSLAVKRPGKSNATVALRFNTGTAPGRITGSVTTEGAPLAFTALPGVYTGAKSSLHPLNKNRYTVILPAPAGTLGNGSATLVIDSKGTANFAGRLADGTAFKAAPRMVTAEGNGGRKWVVPVHVPLYKGFAGMLLGEVVLPVDNPARPEIADRVEGGSLGWLRPADARATVSPQGFLKSMSPAGQKLQLTNGR